MELDLGGRSGLPFLEERCCRAGKITERDCKVRRSLKLVSVFTTRQTAQEEERETHLQQGVPRAPQLRTCVMSQAVWKSLAGLGPPSGLIFPSSLESEEFWVGRDDLLSPVFVLSIGAQEKGSYSAHSGQSW